MWGGAGIWWISRGFPRENALTCNLQPVKISPGNSPGNEKNHLAIGRGFSYNCGRPVLMMGLCPKGTLAYVRKVKANRFAFLPHYGAVAHLARAPRLHRGGRGFDSLQLHQKFKIGYGGLAALRLLPPSYHIA